MSVQFDEKDASELALRSLTGKEPSPIVKNRIVQGALARRSRTALPLGKLVAGLALAGAAAAAVVVVGIRVDGSAGTDGQLASPAGLEAPAAGQSRQAGRFAVGPHRVEVAPPGELRFDSIAAGAAELRLLAGSALFEVQPLGPGESFRVRTDEVLVEVVGTRFEVGTAGSCSTVSVREGRVRVSGPEGASFLGAGESGRWCAAPAAAPAAVPAAGLGEGLVREALVLVSRGEELDRAAGLLERYREEHPGGAFDEEALFHLCLVRARLGDRTAADRLSHEFKARFPASPRVERLERWLERTAH